MSDQDQNNQSASSQQNDMIDQVALTAFVDDLIKSRNDSGINEQNIERVRNALLDEVNEAINLHLLDKLSDRAQIELDKLLDTDPSDEQLNQFFIREIPNLEVEIAAALLNFRAAYLYPLSQKIAKAVESISPVPTSPDTQTQRSDESGELTAAPVPPPQTIQPEIKDILSSTPSQPAIPPAVNTKRWN